MYLKRAPFLPTLCQLLKCKIKMILAYQICLMWCDVMNKLFSRKDRVVLKYEYNFYGEGILILNYLLQISLLKPKRGANVDKRWNYYKIEDQFTINYLLLTSCYDSDIWGSKLDMLIKKTVSDWIFLSDTGARWQVKNWYHC